MKENDYKEEIEKLIEEYYSKFENPKKKNGSDFSKETTNNYNILKQLILLDFFGKKGFYEKILEKDIEEIEFAGFKVQGNEKFRSLIEDNLNGSRDHLQRLTIQISEDVIERAKNAVYWTRGLTLAQLTEDAIEKAVRALEKNSVVYDDKTGKPLKDKGDAFPKRKEDLKSGRSLK